MTDPLPAGRELDATEAGWEAAFTADMAFRAEVAEKVLGWKRPDPTRPFQPWDMDPTRYPGCCLTHQLPDFRTSWDAMRLVVERLVALEYDVESIVDDDGASVIVQPRVEGREGRGSADTLPHAVALAALAALKATTSAQQGAEASHVEADRA